MRPLHVATACNHLNIIDYLMTKGANINEQNREGLSPLHIAVIHAHLGSVKYLVGKEADIDLKDKCGVSPLLYALTITIGCPDISFRLIKYSSSLAQGVDVKSVFNTLLHNHAPVICYPRAQSLALDLRVQSHKRNLETFDEHTLPKKRKLENISEALQFEDKSTVNLTHRSPISSFNSVSVQPANKDLRL